MSTEYTLHIAVAKEPKQILNILASDFRLKWDGDNHLFGSAVWFSAVKENDLSKEVTEEAFGFRPSVRIRFRIDPNSDEYEDGRHLIIKATVALLLTVPGDAVLLFNDEYILLQRIHGKLVLNASWREWESHNLLKDVTLPYTMRDLPSPLL